MNWWVAGAKRSSLPQSIRSGIDASAGNPKTVLCVQSS